MSIERRKHFRTGLRQLSVVRDHRGRLLSTVIHDISQLGAGLSADEPIPLCGVVQLCCPGVHCEIEYRVAHQRHEGSFSAGVRFLLQPDQQERLGRFLSYHRRRNASAA